MLILCKLLIRSGRCSYFQNKGKIFVHNIKYRECCGTRRCRQNDANCLLLVFYVLRVLEFLSWQWRLSIVVVQSCHSVGRRRFSLVKRWWGLYRDWIDGVRLHEFILYTCFILSYSRNIAFTLQLCHTPCSCQCFSFLFVIFNYWCCRCILSYSRNLASTPYFCHTSRSPWSFSFRFVMFYLSVRFRQQCSLFVSRWYLSRFGNDPFLLVVVFGYF